MEISSTIREDGFRQQIASFVTREIAPHAAAVDRGEGTALDHFPRMAREKLLGITVPQPLGGAGEDLLLAAVAMEEIARGCGSTAMAWGAQSILCAHTIHRFGSEEQKLRFLPALCAGSLVGAFALTEKEAGSNIAAMATKAEPEGKGFRLTGEKHLMSNGPAADLVIVFALAGDEIGAFLVEKEFPGVVRGERLGTLGMRGYPVGGVRFDGVSLPTGSRLGPEGQGKRILMSSLVIERVLLASLGVGLAQAAFDSALAYAREREQFGKKIGEFQLVQAMLAEMATSITAARLMALKVAADAKRGDLKSADAAMAKLFTAETAERVTTLAVQMFGGWGYTTAHPVERYYRDARVLTLGGGTTEIQKLTIARELLK